MENKTVVCPECMNDIELEAGRKYVVGDIIECPFCGSEVEVVSVADGKLEVVVVEEEK